jgi:hypothetical protein
MRLLLALLLVFGVLFAATVKADVRATKDTGNENLPKMDIGIKIDCDSKALIVEAKSNQTGEPVSAAQTYLFYTDYTYQLVGTGSTNGSGISRINVVGNQDYLTALFILRVDKSGYQSRETEFTYKYCFQNPPPDIGGDSGPGQPPPPELKKIDMDIQPVCSGKTVTGERAVVKSDGKPLAGAFVSIEDISPAKKIAVGNTDTSGEFQFPGCGDQYSVRASAGGYESLEVNVTLIACNDCPLPPPPPPQNNTNTPPPKNHTGQNQTQPGGQNPAPAPSGGCPLGLAILSILVLRARE